MSIEEAIMGGIVFKGKKDKPQEDEKVKTKAKKAIPPMIASSILIY